jgi:hypothetical protein
MSCSRVAIINGDDSQVNVCGSCLKMFRHGFRKIFYNKFALLKKARGSCEDS